MVPIKSHIMEQRRRIAVIGLPILQSVHNLSSIAVANYAERRGNWQFVFAAEATVEAFRFLRNVECDGAIVRVLSSQMEREAKRLRMPVINVSSWLDVPVIPTVRHDYHTCGREAATYLLNKGFRRFGCVMMPGGCIARRAQPFLQAIKSKDLSVSTFHLKAHTPYLRQPLHASERTRFVRWVEGLERPTALVLTDDWYAPALIQLCKDAGIAIPRDIVVLSIGIHSETLNACPVPLSAVQENHEAQMQRVVDDLELRMAGRKTCDRLIEIPPLGVVERSSTAIPAIEDRVIAEAVDYIRSHPADRTSISRIADKLRMSRATLDRRFLEQTGHTPHAFILKERIALARELLKDRPEATLDSIARSCGFSGRRRMNIAFKQATGLLPGKWRDG